MESRKLKVIFAKSGSGSITTRLTLPKSWMDELGISVEDREVIAILDNFDKNDGRIIIKKMNDEILEKEENRMRYLKRIKESIDKEKNLFFSDYDIVNGMQSIIEKLTKEGVKITKEKEEEILSVMNGEKEPDYMIAEKLYEYLMEQDAEGERSFALYEISLKKEIFSEMAEEISADFFWFFQKRRIDPFYRDKELEISKIFHRLCVIKEEILFKLDSKTELENAAAEIKKIKKLLEQEDKNGI